MKYEELIALVLQGRSVNATSKAIGLPQRTLDEYVKAKNLPDCERAIVLARAAGVSIEEAVLAIAAKKAELRPERVHSFLRPAMASVLAFAVAVNLFLTPTPANAALPLASQGNSLYIM
jgi:hypothetical protein